MPEIMPRRSLLRWLALGGAATALPAVSACSGSDSGAGSGAAASGAGEDDTRVMVIRHAEKPTHDVAGVTEQGTPDDASLTVPGWIRAGALAGLFAPEGTAVRPGLARPARVYCAEAGQDGEKRPLLTVTPLAARLGVTPDTRFGKGDEHQLATELTGGRGPVLVCWQHGEIPRIVARLGRVTPTPPKDWPDDRFDLVWVFTRQADGWRFSQVPQLLLAGDRP